MKKLFCILVAVFFIISIPLISQNSAKVFETDNLIFFGLDFSKAKMIGTSEFKSGEEIKNTYFKAWNDVLVKEKKKYNIAETFQKTNVLYATDYINERNQNTDPSKIVVDVSDSFSFKEVPLIIKEYNPKDFKDGIGLVIIVESFDKSKLLGTMYVVFFDIASKKVLISEKMSGEPGGFGLRNYWIRTVFNVLKKIKDSDYELWKSKYNN